VPSGQGVLAAASEAALASCRSVITRYNSLVKLTVRSVGNSLGIIIPKSTLDEWGVGRGDELELVGRSIRPTRRSGSSQGALDELKRNLAAAVTARCSAHEIRAHSLANLHRWKQNDAWVSAYDEWQRLLESGSDGELFATMLGRDEHANRLRQSPPYVGLLPLGEVKRLNEEASA
jgi:antitoxin component of MazEF toxin-antitoxin module